MAGESGASVALDDSTATARAVDRLGATVTDEILIRANYDGPAIQFGHTSGDR